MEGTALMCYWCYSACTANEIGPTTQGTYTREIEDTILLALQKPEVYDDIARATCCKFGIDRPQVVPVQGLPQEKMKWNSNFSGRTSVEPVDDQVFQLVF
ncbi:uncharacterized protein LOC100500949 [Zea mays]|uniref:Uncharacterized protein n=1 Tax=Zea mays TaxID=4577 RepID=B4FPU9_MAIZE|nr:uncharacterized protein LOC100500949 [Zea mays]ACF84142.1 unknown [Zea mays]|eukprot:NP_001182779.1 uncharacterized protein LOC100500949 [Zea mays]